MTPDRTSDLSRRIREQAEAVFPVIQAIRRDIHAHPELSYEEFRTSAIIHDYLKGLDIEPEPQFLETGVVALLKGRADGPQIALRADIDALPLSEENACAYSSRHPGTMHACGHDMHTAMLLGAASILAGMRDELAGSVLFIFQPAEEKAPGGARPLIEAGLFKRFSPSAVIGQHCFPNVPSGKVALCRGSFMAAADELYFTVSGQGGHASAPHKASDPVLAAAHIITAAQHLVSRVAPPHEPAVVSISSIQGGHAPNVIPSKVVMSGTMRTMNEELRRLLHQKLHETVRHVGEGLGVEAEVEIRQGYPVLYNDPEITRHAAIACSEYLGRENVIDSEPLMTAEDFAYYLQEKPGTFWQIGTGLPEQDRSNMLHSPTFDPDENALSTGAGLLAYSAIRFMDYFAGEKD
ncbi:MAG: amidohydrolase [Pelodictyon luteolum]|uniref:Amidohydrolase n=1 Tax=Pelodictyon luteolum TaxID=1100 RepID=A0A165LPB2_PELLU|nr:M20 family metallopeptidase [Pelodictyon luteolum]KZK74260.1 MAG: amidohydrolase [Pelodictyon luteolum]